MMEWIDTLRYDFPKVFKTLVVLFVVVVGVFGFMLIPDTSLTRAIGISDIQRRITATGNGLYWSMRAAIHNTGPADYEQLYGSIEGVDESSALVVSIPSQDRYTRRTFRLANTEIIDLYGAVQAIGSLRMETARFDIYNEDNAVVWIRGTPLNVRLIETGVARPAAKPPSNIFDRAFAAYYWRLAKAQ